jgi:hypothetical protein
MLSIHSLNQNGAWFLFLKYSFAVLPLANDQSCRVRGFALLIGSLSSPRRLARMRPCSGRMHSDTFQRMLRYNLTSYCALGITIAVMP